MFPNSRITDCPRSLSKESQEDCLYAQAFEQGTSPQLGNFFGFRSQTGLGYLDLDSPSQVQPSNLPNSSFFKEPCSST